MSKKNDRFLEGLKARQAQASAPTSEPETPKPSVPEAAAELPTYPEVRAEYLSDELADTRQALEAERKARRQAEQRVEQQARPGSLSDLLRSKQVRKRRSWR